MGTECLGWGLAVKQSGTTVLFLEGQVPCSWAGMLAMVLAEGVDAVGGVRAGAGSARPPTPHPGLGLLCSGAWPSPRPAGGLTPQQGLLPVPSGGPGLCGCLVASP